MLEMAANKGEADLERLRILVSDGKGHRLEEVTHTVTSLGHEVVGQTGLGDVAPLTVSLRPDAAIVIVGESSEHALELIGRIVTEAACPVIAILDVEDEAFIRDAAKRGIFAYITLGRDASALQSSLDVVLSRFAEYQGLEGAFARRAITERAKGILMERHSFDEHGRSRCCAMRHAARTANSSRSPRPSRSASTCFPGRLLSRVRSARPTLTSQELSHVHGLPECLDQPPPPVGVIRGQD
jgi:response regulator NasT